MGPRAKDEALAVRAVAKPRARAPVPRERPGARGVGAALLNLQRTAGNGAVQRLLVQARPDDGHGPAPAEVEEAIESARGSGQPLDGRVRGEMEQALGADFGSVRVHADAAADRISRSINARAFTTGQDVFFREGTYDPGSSAGRGLLAHELTHVVQQSGDEVRAKLVIGPAGDQYEQEADRVAAEVVSRTADTAGSGARSIQRVCDECEEQMQRQMADEEEDSAPQS